MTTLGELKEKLQVWSKSPNPEVVPWDDIGVLAYQRVSRRIMPSELDTLVTLDPEAATNVRSKVWAHTAPTGMLKLVSLANNGARVRSYGSGALQELEGAHPYGHAVVGSEIWVAPGVGGDLKLVYNKQDTQPPGDDDTNYGLGAYLDAYLAAGLVEFYRFAEDMENEEAALGRFRGIADELNAIADQQRRGAGAGGVR